MEEQMDSQVSSQPEVAQDTTPEYASDDTPTIDDYNKSKEYGTNQKTRAEKAEKRAKELETELSQMKKQTSENTERETQKTNEPDYAKEAFLEQRGLTNPDDKKIVYDEAKRLNLPLTDVLGMEHIKARIKSNQNQREAELGMPDTNGKPSSSTKNSVDYWVDKKNSDGSYATPTDPELANKVIDARMKNEGAGKMFDDSID